MEQIRVRLRKDDPVRDAVLVHRRVTGVERRDKSLVLADSLAHQDEPVPVLIAVICRGHVFRIPFSSGIFSLARNAHFTLSSPSASIGDPFLQSPLWIPD